MVKTVSISLLPAQAADEQVVKSHIAGECGINAHKITGYHIQKRSIDARQKQAKIVLQVAVYIDEPPVEQPKFDPELQDVTNAPGRRVYLRHSA